eukprot:767971-Hanusia_phi.AAC.6
MSAWARSSRIPYTSNLIIAVAAVACTSLIVFRQTQRSDIDLSSSKLTFSIPSTFSDGHQPGRRLLQTAYMGNSTMTNGTMLNSSASNNSSLSNSSNPTGVPPPATGQICTCQPLGTLFNLNAEQHLPAHSLLKSVQDKFESLRSKLISLHDVVDIREAILHSEVVLLEDGAFHPRLHLDSTSNVPASQLVCACNETTQNWQIQIQNALTPIETVSTFAQSCPANSFTATCWINPGETAGTFASSASSTQWRRCVPSTCGPYSVLNGKLSLTTSTGSNQISDARPGDSLQVKCLPGYELSGGQQTVTCLQNCSWSHALTCNRKVCPSIYSPLNTEGISQGLFEETRQVNCIKGFRAASSNPSYNVPCATSISAYCSEAGRWQLQVMLLVPPLNFPRDKRPERIDACLSPAPHMIRTQTP